MRLGVVAHSYTLSSSGTVVPPLWFDFRVHDASTCDNDSHRYKHDRSVSLSLPLDKLVNALYVGDK